MKIMSGSNFEYLVQSIFLASLLRKTFSDVDLKSSKPFFNKLRIISVSAHQPHSDPKFMTEISSNKTKEHTEGSSLKLLSRKLRELT